MGNDSTRLAVRAATGWAMLVLSASCGGVDDPPSPPPTNHLFATFAVDTADPTSPKNDFELLQRLSTARRALPRARLWEQELAEEAGLAATVDEARKILGAGWTVRSNPITRIERPIDWERNPRRDRNWLMQLHTWAPLLPVAHAYALTGEAVFLDVVRHVVHDWIAANIDAPAPPRNEMRWYDMATAKRAVLIAFLIDHELRQEHLDVEELVRLIGAARRHVDVLKQRKLRILSNHGLFSVAGMRAVLSVVPGWAGYDEEMAYTRQWVTDVVTRQYTSEGIHTEDTPVYHVHIIGALRSVIELRVFGDVPHLPAILELARERSVLMFHPNGDPVLVGDGAEVQPAAPAPVQAFLRTDGREGRPPKATTGIFPVSGVAVYRSPLTQEPFAQHTFLFFNAANHGSGHTHHDIGTFEWSNRGAPIVVDSGGFTYDRVPARPYHQSVRAGNAVEVDEKNPPIRGPGAFVGSGLVDGGVVDGGRFFAAARMEHAREKYVHQRTLVLEDGKWLLVFDAIVSGNEETRSVRQWFQLHEALTLTLGEQAASAAWPDGRVMHVGELTGAGRLGEPEGEPGTPKGWVSRRYHERVPRFNFYVATEAKGELRLATLFSVRSEIVAPTAAAEGRSVVLGWTDEAGNATTVELEDTGGVWRLSKPR